MSMMGYTSFLLVILYSFVYSITAEKYLGAVVGYSPLVDPNWTVDTTVQKNVAKYVDIIKSMRNRADIVIFPEYGLTTLYPKLQIKVKEHLFDYAMIIGKIGYNPCKDPVDDKSRDNNLITLSCAVNTTGLYVYFSTIEVDIKDRYYFTDVTFDANGEIISKCQRSISVNGTSGGFKILPANNLCTFNAKFPNSRVVTFNILHDDDMVKKSNKNLNYIAPSLLLDSLPLNYAASIWSGFSADNEANVLVSEYFDSTIKSGAYGISHFDGNGVRGNFSVGLSVNNEQYDVIIQEVPLEKKKTEDILVEVTTVKKIPSVKYDNLTVIDDLKKISNRYLTTKKGQSVHCAFKAELDRDNIDPYRWVATLEQTIYLGQEVFLVRCALIKPTENTSNLKFKSVSVTVQVDDDIVNQVIPSAVTVDGSIPKYIYKKTNKDTSMVLSSTTGEILIGFGMVFILDSRLVSSAACNDVSIILMTIVAVVVKYWY